MAVGPVGALALALLRAGYAVQRVGQLGPGVVAAAGREALTAGGGGAARAVRHWSGGVLAVSRALAPQ